jgi:hypothetical protein
VKGLIEAISFVLEMPARRCDVTVILTFADDEELIGAACLRLRSFLREQALSCEILAVDEGAGDNSRSVLALLFAELPELSVLHAAEPGRGYALAVERARGRALWLVSPQAALAPLAPFQRAYRLVDQGQRDVVQIEGRFLLLRRIRTLSVFETTGRLGFREIVRRARRAGFAVETPGRNPSPSALRFLHVWRGLAPRTSRPRG